MDAFQLEFKDAARGWIHGEVYLGGKTLDFRMSYCLGDGLLSFIMSVWSFYPKQDRLTPWSHRLEELDLLPCEEICIDEEGTKVRWKISQSEGNAQEPMLDVTVTAERCLDGESYEDAALSGQVSYREYASAVMQAIDALIRQYGVAGYYANFWNEFPVTEFVIIKAVLMHKPLEGLEDELRILRAPFYMAFMEEPIRKMTLESNAFYYGLIPSVGEIVRQRLTVNDRGRVNISAYDAYDTLIEQAVLSIGKERGKSLIKEIADYFEEKPNPVCGADCGWWKLTLTNKEGENYRFEGSMLDDDWFGEISETIRLATSRRDLFAFDGEDKSGLIFLSCVFYDGGKSYYFLTDNETVGVGDYVRVPVGQNGRTAIVEVVNVEYFKEDEVPMPLEQVKSILEVVDEFGEYPEDEE